MGFQYQNASVAVGHQKQADSAEAQHFPEETN